MKKTQALIFVFVFVAGILQAINPVTADGKSPFVEVVKNIRESVVNIQVDSEIRMNNSRQMFSPFDDDFFRFFGTPQAMPQNRKLTSMGSGFIFKQTDRDVYIITNNHVVENAKNNNGEITVSLADKAKYKGEIVGLDPYSDLAVIKIVADDDEKIVIAPLGDSDQLDIGDWAIAIGNPFGQLGLDRTVTVGVISATGRSNLNFGENSPVYQDYLQTDAAINPGNSGGPLLNIKGEVIGVNAAITSPAGGNVGIGFAIPVNMVKKVVQDLISVGKVRRAYLGVLSQDLNAELAKSLKLGKNEGILVAKVEKDTPAQDADLRAGDVIVKIDGQPIENVAKFRILVANSKVGETVPFTIIRDGKEKTVKVKLTEIPGGIAANDSTSTNFDLGIEVQNLDQEVAKKLKVRTDNGVVIASVAPNSTAEKAGLNVGDVIHEINRQPVSSVKEYNDIMKKIRDAKEKNNLLLLYIETAEGGYKFLTLKI